MDNSDFDPETLKLLRDTFRSELEERLQVITEELLRLEKGVENATRQETLNTVFREAHSIKGAARGVGLASIGTIAHSLESMFSSLKQENAILSPENIDLCLEALDRMRGAYHAYSAGTSADFDEKAFCGKLQQMASQEKNRLLVLPDKSAQMATLENEEAISKPSPIPETPTGTKSGADFIRVTVDKLERITALSEELQVAKLETEDHFTDMQLLRAGVDQLAKTLSSFQSLARHNINASLLDEMKTIVERYSNNVMDIKSTVYRLHKAMRSVVNNLNSISSSLQSDTRMLRLVPVSTLLKPSLRTARDIARELGKKVDVTISGGEIEIDRVVLESIRDPLNHLLRNAIDHGIETPELRRKANKSEVGKVTLSISSEGSQIFICLEDDGQGVLVEKVKSIALRKNLYTNAELQVLSREDVLDIIFHPGFSTKEIITNISGRGYGLDVVRTNLQKIKGSVRIETVEGKGSKFILRFPLTLSTEHGLLVRAGGQIFTIQTASIERAVEIGRDDVVEVEASHTLLFHGQPIPFRYLAETLEMDIIEPDPKEKWPVVIISKGRRVVAFLVEEILGDREIVIKQLQPPLYSVRNVAGATMTGSGTIVLALNAGDLVDSALRPGKRSRLLTKDAAVAEQMPPEILVVDDSITSRTLIRSVLENNGYVVTTAVNGKEALQILQTKAFGLVVTDVQMPVMDGFELTKHIKEQEKIKETPVIIVSSLANEADKKRGVDVGADAYIVKGQFESKTLLSVVKQLVVEG
ncbi:MAG: hybrid sensor histidine kinase/response regulator [Candidatus Brocadiaceae bacterium]|nr:hybrid sensor histidine kinase/response regulator [Candidatus Brocadiaceae bacterium]